MIRLSAGTAASMGLTGNRMDAYPTTAYMLSGKQCLMKCSFCPQGVGGKEVLNRLGRISWPEYDWSAIEKGLPAAEANGVKRICLQSVRHKDGIETLLEIIKKIKAITDLPLSLSAWLRDEEEAAVLIEAGVERISVSLDVVSPGAFEKIKGGSFHDRLELLLRCAKRIPGRMSTHIICGLGETEAEVLTLIDRLLQKEITVALFAFVPLRGTALEGAAPPPVDSYRRIQAGYYLLREKKAVLSSFLFSNGQLVSYGLPENTLIEILTGGNAFQTSGCPDCNRPFYNERPGGVIYNYHRPLNLDENRVALNQLIDSLETKVEI